MKNNKGGYGVKINTKEKNLTVNSILDIINNKHIDCINFNKCNDAFIEYEIKIKPRSDINWKCPFMCDHYSPVLEIEHKIYDFTEEEINKVNIEVDNMNEKQLYKLMCELFSSKQYFEKYKGESIEERYSSDDSRVRLLKRKRS